MTAIPDTLHAIREEHRLLRDDISLLETGQWKLTDQGDPARSDVTKDWLSELKRRADHLSRVIAAYEGQNA
jgi:hypothetical protein